MAVSQTATIFYNKFINNLKIKQMQDVVNGEVMSEYEKFLNAKRHTIGNFGFEPLFIPKIAFDFQKHIIEKSIRKGRIATKIDQIIYSLGAMIGGLSGLFITSIML